jgi:hypothetical protein
MGVLKKNNVDVRELDSFPGVRKKREQLRGASERFAGWETRNKRAKEAKPKLSIEERAVASLRGESQQIVEPEESRAALAQELQVLSTAMNIAKNELDEEVSRASFEVCQELVGEYEARVKEQAIRALAYQEAEAAVLDLTRQITAKGFNLLGEITRFPRLNARLGNPADGYSALAVFLRELRARGIEV